MTQTLTRPETSAKPQTDRPRPWNVVLLDDDHHTYDYVVRMLQTLFRHTPEAALQMAKVVDRDGRVVCCTAHKELAELKREQVHGFGADPLIAACAGAMSAIIEPADQGDDDGHAA